MPKLKRSALAVALCAAALSSPACAEPLLSAPRGNFFSTALSAAFASIFSRPQAPGLPLGPSLGPINLLPPITPLSMIDIEAGRIAEKIQEAWNKLGNPVAALEAIGVDVSRMERQKAATLTPPDKITAFPHPPKGIPSGIGPARSRELAQLQRGISGSIGLNNAIPDQASHLFDGSR